MRRTPLLRDLTATGMNLPDLREEAREDRAGAISGFIRDRGGTGVGIYVTRAASPAEQVAELADQVQEWATDVQADPERPSEWPLCREHQLAHALHADVRDDIAVWVCPHGEHVVSPVGALTRHHVRSNGSG